MFSLTKQISVIVRGYCTFSLYCAFIILLSACSGETKKTEITASDSVQLNNSNKPIKSDDEESSIILSKEAARLAGIQVVSLQSQTVKSTVSGPARILPTQTGQAHVGATIPGRISKLFVNEGTTVKQGQALAELESFDLSEIKSEYLKAHAEVLRTEKNLTRQRQLSQENIGSKRQLDEAESEHSQAIARRSAALSKLNGLGINPDQLTDAKVTSLIIRSPITGIVSKRLAGLGDFAEPNKDIFDVLNLTTVWVDAQLPISNVAGLNIGGAGYFQTQDGHSFNGKIVFISPAADPASHAVTVRLELLNPMLILKPETFGTAVFETSNTTSEGFSVPASTLEKENDEYYIYKQLTDTTFARIHVSIIRRTNKDALITSDELKHGDNIVSDGTFYLKSARLKEKLQDAD